MARSDHQSADNIDNYLQGLFAQGGGEIPDAGFTAQVMARIARTEWLRMGVFAVAMAVGAVVVLTQLISPLTELFALLPQSMVGARMPAITPTLLAIMAAVLAAVLTPMATYMLED